MINDQEIVAVARWCRAPVPHGDKEYTPATLDPVRQFLGLAAASYGDPHECLSFAVHYAIEKLVLDGRLAPFKKGGALLREVLRGRP